MNQDEKLVLIEGVFENEEAKEILMNIFLTKISYHQRNNFSFRERFGHDNPTSKIRIPQLQKEIVKLQRICQLAETRQGKLKIDSEIKILLLA